MTATLARAARGWFTEAPQSKDVQRQQPAPTDFALDEVRCSTGRRLHISGVLLAVRAGWRRTTPSCAAASRM
jgi:hypothetical protein